MNWTKDEAGAARLAGHTDVGVRFTDCLDGNPFCAAVGGAVGYFAHLTEAMDWCEEVARGRAVLKSPEPFDQADAAYDNFLEARGLTAQ
jgi:hypothetical protein